jgi:CTP synthase
MTPLIFVTGGVVSSLGKGIAAASLAAILEARGLRVTMMKLDPYINVDPGTMSPFQHGEVYVTDDGAETDLDLGHYERFVRTRLTGKNSITTGKIYESVIRQGAPRRLSRRHRAGDPAHHRRDQACIYEATSGYDVALVEIGGTVGDIESLPFLEAIRQIRIEHGAEMSMFMHLTLVPYIKAAGEIKTKPTQHSVKELRSIGIQPDVLLCRCEQPLPQSDRRKIALFTNVPEKAVISRRGRRHHLQACRCGCTSKAWTTSCWIGCNIKASLRIFPSGPPWWMPSSIRATKSASRLSASTSNTRMPTSRSARPCATAVSSSTRGSTCAGSNPRRWNVGAAMRCAASTESLCPADSASADSKARSAPRALRVSSGIPYFGICYGMHAAVVEFARNVAGLSMPTPPRMIATAWHPVIALITEWRTSTGDVEKRDEGSDLGGTMRLGAQECRLKPGTLARELYGQDVVRERHRHRYEFNNRYRRSWKTLAWSFPASRWTTCWSR